MQRFALLSDDKSGNFPTDTLEGLVFSIGSGGNTHPYKVEGLVSIEPTANA